MVRIDELDFTYIDDVRCCRGHVLPYGATLTDGGGINFSVSSHDATACTLALYHQGEDEPYALIPIPDHFLPLKVGQAPIISVPGPWEHLCRA